jgi:hypothetical protein
MPPGGGDNPKNNFLFNSIFEQLPIQIISHFARADLEWLTAEIRAKLFERSEFDYLVAMLRVAPPQEIAVGG